MKMLKAVGVVVLYATIASRPAHADIITYQATIATTGLIGSVAGPFALAFQFAPGSGGIDANNAVTIGGFSFGGGSVGGPPLFVLGGATGDLSTAVKLSDTDDINFFAQPFIPGSDVRFTITMSLNPDAGGIPDDLAFYILDATGQPIPTTAGAFIDTFFEIAVSGNPPTVLTFSSDPTRAPAAGGAPLSVQSVTLSQILTAPEPNTSVLTATALLCLTGIRIRRRSFVSDAS